MPNQAARADTGPRNPSHIRKKRPDIFSVAVWFCALTILAFIGLPLVQMITEPSLGDLAESISDRDVQNAIWMSIKTSGLAALISLFFGTPLAYLLARKEFWGKKLLESAVDLPIMIPHPVIGIAVLSLAGANHPIGRFLADLGVRLMGTEAGLVVVLTFVGLPFHINSVRNSFQAVPPRLEKVARSLGAGPAGAFFRVTLPLAWRGVLAGMIMCLARAISEFGAVVIVAYHPMTAPVMIYERFTAYGLKYSQPVAVWLIFVSLVLFLGLRLLSGNRKART
ncbi:ABC transporter permease [Dethiosulfatarculus sandiegensis]|uniref:ABC transporter permease n=1 Tax=Dethiosulfatarculus sandiegensis TaxID=1429043 RepID=UPI0009EC4E43|nr:ABC transporter permease [Dethiosulfatarculus sandiegensis]